MASSSPKPAPKTASTPSSGGKKLSKNLKTLSGGSSIRAFWAQPDPPEFTWRLMAYFAVARLLIAAAVLFYFGYRTGLNLPPQTQTTIFVMGSVYVLVALLSLVLPLFSRKHFYIHLTLRLTFDVICLSVFFLLLESSRAGLVILFLLPVLGAAVLGTVTAALFAAALSSLVILYVPFRAIAAHTASDISLLQAGLYGLAFMATALLMRMLAQRQIAQEALAADREYELHLQQAINRLMVLDMQDGVMLARSDGTVIAINPAASTLIGIATAGVWAGTDAQHDVGVAPNLKQLIHLRPLLEAMRRWMRVRDEAPRMIEIERPSLSPSSQTGEPDTTIAAARIRLRARFVYPSLDGQESSLSLLTTRMPYLEEQTRNFAFAEQAQLRKQRAESLPDALREALRDTVLIYLESWEKITEQTQQEKLAAMGRLVASIAHEVRNPLAAISHASELLAEEIHQTTPHQLPPVAGGAGASGALVPMRMLQIIGDNVKRLDRIVSDVLLLSRRPRTESGPILLQKELVSIVEQWRRNAALTNPSQLADGQSKLQEAINANLVRVNAENMPPARFDTAHLQQILFNLLDNAKRYCRNLPGSIVVSAYVLDESHAELMIWNDGPEIPPDVERSLFEPFFTSEMQGTGLGLYLARELCYANQAHIRYASVRRERLHAALSPLGLFGQDKIPHRAFLITMRLDRPS